MARMHCLITITAVPVFMSRAIPAAAKNLPNGRTEHVAYTTLAPHGCPNVAARANAWRVWQLFAVYCCLSEQLRANRVHKWFSI